eukprot:86838_1
MASQLSQSQQRKIAASIIAEDNDFKSNTTPPPDQYTNIKKISNSVVTQCSHYLTMVFNKNIKKQNNRKFIISNDTTYKSSMKTFYDANCYKYPKFISGKRTYVVAIKLSCLSRLKYKKIHHKPKPQTQTKTKSTTTPIKIESKRKRKRKPIAIDKSSQNCLIQSLTEMYTENEQVSNKPSLSQLLANALNLSGNNNINQKDIVHNDEINEIMDNIKINLENKNDHELKNILKNVSDKDKTVIAEILYNLCVLLKENFKPPPSKRQ